MSELTVLLLKRLCALQSTYKQALGQRGAPVALLLLTAMVKLLR